MNFKPILNNVLVRCDDSETKTASGFFIPDSSIEKSNTGTVLAVGPGKSIKDGRTISIPVEIGNKIMFAPGAGIPVKIEGKNYIVLKEEDLIAVVE